MRANILAFGSAFSGHLKQVRAVGAENQKNVLLLDRPIMLIVEHQSVIPHHSSCQITKAVVEAFGG